MIQLGGSVVAVALLVAFVRWLGVARPTPPLDAASAKALLDVAQFWSRKKNLPGMMLETQNNNLGACRLYERCGYVMGGVDHLRYRGIDPQTGHYFDDTKRYIDALTISDADKRKVFEGNARRVYPRLDAQLRARGL